MFTCSLLVNTKKIGFYMLILYPETVLNSLLRVSSTGLFCVLISWNFLCRRSCHLQIGQYYFFLFILYTFYFLIKLPNIFSPIWKAVVRTAYLPSSQPQGKWIQSFTINCDISYSIFIDVLYQVEECTLYSYFLNLWTQLNLSNTFSASADIIM